MSIFNSYVKLPEGIIPKPDQMWSQTQTETDRFSMLEGPQLWKRAMPVMSVLSPTFSKPSTQISSLQSLDPVVRDSHNKPHHKLQRAAAKEFQWPGWRRWRKDGRKDVTAWKGELPAHFLMIQMIPNASKCIVYIHNIITLVVKFHLFEPVIYNYPPTPPLGAPRVPLPAEFARWLGHSHPAALPRIAKSHAISTSYHLWQLSSFTTCK